MNQEEGGEFVAERLSAAWISSVNFSEVVAKLADRGIPSAAIDQMIAGLDLEIIDFDRDQAMVAGQLRPLTRQLGLSFGDRACLALARSLGAVALTMDRSWAALDIGVAVELAR